MKCPKCGSIETISSESRGETYCISCGFVLEENRMVEALSFAETSTGGVKAVGQFIPTSGFTMSYGSREIRDLTLQKGYTNIQRIADRFNLAISLVEAAQRIYLMGVQRGFTCGRINQHVAAACLYISCRREKSPYMLIDFSDVLTVPVKTLGKVFVKLLRVLRINVPTIDPSLFMERFASQMQLEDKTREVAHTGVRLVQAMTRDWIATGRRPIGLCGAALLIAARYHGFKINPEDISHIIRMAASTISKRLHEFRKTSTAQLKQSEFETADLLALPIICEPPCLRIPRHRSSILALPPASSDDENEDTEIHGQLQQSTESSKLLALEAAPAIMEENDDDDDDDNNTHNNSVEDQTLLSTDQSTSLVGQRVQLMASADELCNETPSAKALEGLAQRMLNAIENQVSSTVLIDGYQNENHDDIGSTIVQERNATESTNSIIANQHNGETNWDTTSENDPLGGLLISVKQKASELAAINDESSILPNTERKVLQSVLSDALETDELEETLSDVSDGEINSLLLNDEERRSKALIWDELMKEAMPEVYRRLKEKRSRIKDLAEQPCSKKPRRRTGPEELESTATSADSVRAALELRSPALAKKLNQDTLESLFEDSKKERDSVLESNNSNTYGTSRLDSTTALDALLA